MEEEGSEGGQFVVSTLSSTHTHTNTHTRTHIHTHPHPHTHFSYTVFSPGLVSPALAAAEMSDDEEFMLDSGEEDYDFVSLLLLPVLIHRLPHTRVHTCVHDTYTHVYTTHTHSSTYMRLSKQLCTLSLL